MCSKLHHRKTVLFVSHRRTNITFFGVSELLYVSTISIKNPRVADWLLARAVEHGGGTWEPEPLTDPVEEWAERARRVALSRPR